MDSATFQIDVLPVLTECAKLLERSSELIKSPNAIVLIESEGLYPPLLYAFNKLIRKLKPGSGIDLILHSHGGVIDTASATASLCKFRFGRFRIIVPFMAKSAATLIALAADERLFTASAQLGPVDPQVRHPEKGVYFPAHSIEKAVERVETTKDNLVKVAMVYKLDPFLTGAYSDTIQACKQCIKQVVETWQNVDKAGIVSAFTDRYKSHGYPIDCKVMRAIGVPFTAIEDEAEEVIGSLHEKCLDLLEDAEGSIILTKDEYLFQLGEFRGSGRFSTAQMPLAAVAVSGATT